MTARVLQRPGRRSCAGGHEWVLSWPAAVVRQCARCGAWLVPSDGVRANAKTANVVPLPIVEVAPVSPTDRMIDNIRDVLGGEVMYVVHHYRCDHWIDDKVRRVRMFNPIKLRTRTYSLPGNYCDGTDDVRRYPIGWRCAVHAPRQERYAA
jgi:hypothetical protein